MTITVKARAPLRLGLAGGGTDVSPYCDKYGGYVLNATIDRYAYAVIETLDSEKIFFSATDLLTEVTMSSKEHLVIEGDLMLHKAVYKHMVQHFNGGKAIPLKLTTFCDAPAGSGLGSSSTLVVTMIRAFVELLNLPMDDYAMAQLAYKIERIDCGLQGGRQDQYSATFGGFNFMEFYENERAIINPLRIKNWILCELEASLVLFFMGISRESARIIIDQSNSLKAGSTGALAAMHGIKHEALVMKEALLRGDFSGFVDSMRLGWESKKLSAKTVSNPHIDEIYDTAINAGALAGKVSGAGGGGFMLFFVSTARRMELIHTLNTFPGQVSNCHFTKSGTQAWRV
ncbi:dehydrogenase [Polynucleobacter sp. AP-Sanab-80-C2]|uniref:GHMP family kinase ATP-binding protein n=1 Tax=Polynucleobacter sp. AP-Sanab-80-C2 TaxID=3108274 RepID=UPI002B222E2F|nr:dehydrogenase [Polynucleobacter sp. AP-Sanab-80-C2]MEA9598522.1 dehydrogenase [Polynucleobacter sp. AP-Sanab-80-C2]